jgi:hypothetical protein
MAFVSFDRVGLAFRLDVFEPESGLQNRSSTAALNRCRQAAGSSIASGQDRQTVAASHCSGGGKWHTPGIGRTGFGGAADRSGPRQRGRPSRKRFLNPAPRGGEIKPETRSVESPDVWRMQTVVKSSVDGICIALAVALLAACAVNLLLLCAWL